MFAWAEEAKGGRRPRRHGGGVSGAGHHERRVDHADRAGRRENRIDDEIRQHARWSRPGHAERGDHRRGWPRTAGCSSPSACRSCRGPASPSAPTAGACRAHDRAVRRGRSRWRGDLARDLSRGVRLPAPLVRLERARGPRQRARAVPRPDLRVQGLRRALPGGRARRGCRVARRKVTILVATSGDTGGAVAAAFHRRPWVDVVVLYPDGLVSPRQAHQLACWGDNVRAFAVHGTFDDCQRMVKEAFQDRALCSAAQRSRRPTASTSAGCCRRWPTTPRRASSIGDARDGRRASIVPSGNLGNVHRVRLGARDGPADRRHRARDQREPHGHRSSLDGGALAAARRACRRSPSAMDVGNPSNMERLRALFPDWLGAHVSAQLVTDEQIRATIREDAEALGYVWDPHGATAAHVYHHAPAIGPTSRGCCSRRRIRRSSTRSWSRSSDVRSRCRPRWRACCACRGRRSAWRRPSTRYARVSDSGWTGAQRPSEKSRR